MKQFNDYFTTERLVFAGFCVIAFSMIWNTVRVVEKNHSLQQQVDRLKEEVSVLELENDNLKLGIAYYKTDTYLEVEARRKLNKAAAGEKVIVLPKRYQTRKVEEEKPVVPGLKEPSNLQQWINFLLGRDSEAA